MVCPEALAVQSIADDPGHGSGIVVGTGQDTEFGVIFSMMQDVEEKRTPLQLSMDDLAKRLSMFSFGVIGLIFLLGVLQKRSWLEMFTIGGVYDLRRPLRTDRCSIARRRSHSRRPANCDDCHPCSWCHAYV